MARSVINDLLQTHRFWLFDIVPSLTPPFYVLGSPTYAFSAITAPEYTFDTREIKEMNSMFKRTVYEGGSVGSITLSRGARVYDDTFYEWVKRAIDGIDSINRTLMLIQYMGASIDRQDGGQGAAIASGFKNSPLVSHFRSIQGVVQNPWAQKNFEDLDRNYSNNIPGRAWVMEGCVPTRYRTGSDFDATDASVSIMEIELAIHRFSEIALKGGGPSTL